MQLNGARFYAAGSNGYLLGVISNGVQYGFTDAAVSSYFSGQVCSSGVHTHTHTHTHTFSPYFDRDVTV